MFVRSLVGSLAVVVVLMAQQPGVGQKPPQKDLPYLLQADNLIPTEAATAQQQDKKNATTFVVKGAASTARTPLGSPLFLIDAGKIEPERLQLYRLEVKNGHREITFSKKAKGNAVPLPLMANPVEGSIYRLETSASLENGEYAITPEGSNQVFCFAVY